MNHTFFGVSIIVPYQNNGWDCGVFVCRYAFGVLSLREKQFTYNPFRDVKENKRKLTALLETEMAESGGFNFDMDDIVRLRRDFATLIDNLSDMYKQKEKLRREEKRRAKESRLGTKLSNTGGMDV